MDAKEFEELFETAHQGIPPELRPEISEIEQFQQNRVWQYIQALLRSQMQKVNVELRSLDGVPLYRAQGRAQKIDEVLRIPAAAIAVLKQKQRIEEKTNAERT